MNTEIIFYRKAYPEEYLSQLAPVLRESGLLYHEVIEALQPLLLKKGVRVLVKDDEQLKAITEELTPILFTTENKF